VKKVDYAYIGKNIPRKGVVERVASTAERTASGLNFNKPQKPVLPVLPAERLATKKSTELQRYPALLTLLP
jgi:hypothetical protein